MGLEIERKFLVDKKLWAEIEKPEGEIIKQGYLLKSFEKTIRVRTKNKKGYLTIKGATEGITRKEYEYEIPKAEADELLNDFCNRFIEKTRYCINHSGKIWEVDEFKSPNKGLILAEIELLTADEIFEKPNWITKEVSDDPQYFNANML